MLSFFSFRHLRISERQSKHTNTNTHYYSAFFHVTFPLVKKKDRKRTESISTKSLSIFMIYFVFFLGVATQGESNRRQDFFFLHTAVLKIKNICLCLSDTELILSVRHHASA